MNCSDPIRPDYLTITDYKLLGKLPDPLTADDGTRVSTPAGWEKRRAEIYKTAIELQYGTLPPEPEFVEVEPLHYAHEVNTYIIRTGTRKDPVSFRMQVLFPNKREGKFPVIVDGDQVWLYHMDRAFLDAARDRGIGWVLFDRTELAHDIASEGRGHGQLYRTYPDQTFGALGAWAWGYSRCVDALELLDLQIDMDWIAFTGHSRGGKTAALAGAADTRAKIVNPNETCAGACGCYRIHMEGYGEGLAPFRSERLSDLWNNFAFWMGPGMKDYTDHEEKLPFDAHYLKAMIAPRILFVSEAAGDIWANPVGSWQTTMASKKVFELLGAADNLFWYFRPGAHGHHVADVEMLAGVIKTARDGEPVDPRMFRLPFTAPGPAFDW